MEQGTFLVEKVTFREQLHFPWQLLRRCGHKNSPSRVADVDWIGYSPLCPRCH